MLEIKDEVTLNNGKKYFVSSKTEYKKKVYYLLTELGNLHNIMICVETERKTLKEVTDKDLISKLSLNFTKASLELIQDDLEDL